MKKYILSINNFYWATSLTIVSHINKWNLIYVYIATLSLIISVGDGQSKYFQTDQFLKITLFVEHYLYHSLTIFNALSKSFITFYISLCLFCPLENSLAVLYHETLKKGKVSSDVARPQAKYVSTHENAWTENTMTMTTSAYIQPMHIPGIY